MTFRRDCLTPGEIAPELNGSQKDLSVFQKDGVLLCELCQVRRTWMLSIRNTLVSAVRRLRLRRKWDF